MARDTSKLVTIPGELHSAATGNIVAAAEEVFDYTKNMYQKDINQEVASSIQELRSTINPQVGYYECSTSGSTAAKTITIDSSVSLSTKILCKVKFVEKNKANNATMNINGTGAKALYYNGVRVAANNSWYPNEVVDLYYDGTNYQAKSCADTLKKVTDDLLGTYTEDKNVIVDTQKTTLAHTTEYIVGYDDSSSYTNYRKLVKAVVSTHQGVNTTCYIHVGFVDQRGWWIESSKHSAEVSAGNNKYEKTITPQDECVIPNGEFVLFEFTTDMWYFGNGGTFWKNLPNLYCVSSSDNLYNQSIISKRVDSVYLRKVEMYYTYYSDQKVALKDEMTSLQTNIDTLETALDASKIYTDKYTNKKYSIVVRDGKLQLVSESITKVYYAGNSFTHHGTNDYWWGYGRGMAASSFSTQYVELTSKLLNATYDKNTYASSIEVHLNNSSYDASTDIPSLPDSGYDLVVIQLGENASVTNSTNYKTNCGKVIDRFRSLCPGAKIMWLMGWYNATKATLIKDACEAHDAYFLDVSNETKRGAFRRGDYVLGASEDMKDNTEEHEVPSNIITHPSDIGMAAISDAIVSKLGYPERCQLYDIVVDTDDFGELSIPYSQWIAGGLVSCKLVINDSDYTLSYITVTNDNTGDDISTTKHLNSSNDTVYTFIMPASSVTITLEWERI